MYYALMYKADFKNYLDQNGGQGSYSVEMTPEDLWKITKENLKLMIGSREFSAILGNSYIENISNGVVQISCDAAYKRDRKSVV